MERNGPHNSPQGDAEVDNSVSSADSTPTLKRLKRKSELNKKDRQFRLRISDTPEYKRRKEAARTESGPHVPALVSVDTAANLVNTNQKDG